MATGMSVKWLATRLLVVVFVLVLALALDFLMPFHLLSIIFMTMISSVAYIVYQRSHVDRITNA